MANNPVLPVVLAELARTLSDVDSSSESDEEIPTRQKINKIQQYVEVTVGTYTDTIFQSHFRLNRRLANTLIGRLTVSRLIPTYEPGRPTILPEKGLLLTLWYIGNQETFRQVSDRFNVSLSSAHRMLRRVVEFLIGMRQECIQWPATVDAKIAIATTFGRKQNIQGVIGAIDGCHFRINKPVENENVFVNRKGYHSILLQGISTNTKLFLDINVGEPGSLHDARVLRRSNIYLRAENPNYFGQYFLVGDSAYPNKRWLVAPFRDNGNLTENQRQFNYKHSATRIVIEHTYGLLKGRFRRLIHLNNFNVQFCSKIIMAACVLHNFCIMEHDDAPIQPYNDDENADPPLQPQQEDDHVNNDDRRTEIMEELFDIPN